MGNLLGITKYCNPIHQQLINDMEQSDDMYLYIQCSYFYQHRFHQIWLLHLGIGRNFLNNASWQFNHLSLYDYAFHLIWNIPLYIKVRLWFHCYNFLYHMLHDILSRYFYPHLLSLGTLIISMCLFLLALKTYYSEGMYLCKISSQFNR